MYWLYFFALTLGYVCGCATVYLYQWLNLRWIARHTRKQEEGEYNEGYTLTIVQSPQSDDEGA